MTKRFIDDQAIFEMQVPITWNYTFVDGHVHSFTGFKPSNADCVQLQISKLKNKEERVEFADVFGYLPSIDIGGVDYRLYPESEHENGRVITRGWITIMDDHILLFSLTYFTPPEAKQSEKPLTDEELEIVYAAISSFRFIEEGVREKTLNSYRFEMFLQAVGATNIILKRAIDNQAFIEATCILSSQIDSMLRLAIILQDQIINNNDRIGVEWIYQGINDKKKSEKDIYKKARELGVIDNEIYDELFELYEDRNRVVHRFIISEITLAEVETISYSYYDLRQRIGAIVDNLESEQLRLGVGMITEDESDPGNKTSHLEETLGKIGRIDYFDGKEGN